jgi:hypothetical protein
MADHRLEMRLRRRMRELAIELLGKPTSETPDELRFGSKGGLWVGLLRGVSVDLGADWRPRGPLELVQRVRDCSRRRLSNGRAGGSRADAIQTLSHSTRIIEAEQAARSERIRGIARSWLRRRGNVIGAQGETDLRSRGLKPPYSDVVRFLERTDRTGEGVVVAVLTHDDREPGRIPARLCRRARCQAAQAVAIGRGPVRARFDPHAAHNSVMLRRGSERRIFSVARNGKQGVPPDVIAIVRKATREGGW